MAAKTGQTSIQKGKILSYERVGEGTKGDRITIKYNRTDDGTNKELSASKLYSTFTTKEKELLKEANTNKGELTLTKTFTQTPGEEEGKGFWNLTSIDAATAFVPKPTTNSKFTKGGSYTGGKSSDSAGQKSGMVLKTAVDLSIAINGKDTTIAHISNLAYSLLDLSNELEAAARNGVSKTSTATKSNVSESVTKTSNLTANAGELFNDNDLDDLESIEIDL